MIIGYWSESFSSSSIFWSILLKRSLFLSFCFYIDVVLFLLYISVSSHSVSNNLLPYNLLGIKYLDSSFLDFNFLINFLNEKPSYEISFKFEYVFSTWISLNKSPPILLVNLNNSLDRFKSGVLIFSAFKLINKILIN